MLMNNKVYGRMVKQISIRVDNGQKKNVYV